MAGGQAWTLQGAQMITVAMSEAGMHYSGGGPAVRLHQQDSFAYILHACAYQQLDETHGTDHNLR